MESVMQNSQVVFDSSGIQEYFDSGTTSKKYMMKTSETMLVYYNNDKELEREMQEYRKGKIMQFSNEISIIINHDEYVDGEVSQSEIFMKEAYENEQMDYVMEALMQIYMDNLSNAHVLEGILVMVSCVPYEVVQPKGQAIAMGLLSNKELLIRDRAIQCFERWNSKKGLDVLKSLDCQPKWLQKYVDKIIKYIERDGVE